MSAENTYQWPGTAEQGSLGDGRHATATDRPGSVEESSDAVRRRVAEGLAIYPQGGRTSLDYGGIPRRPGVAIDVCSMNRVIDYPAADMTITVEAGITLKALQSTLAEANQRLPLDAPKASRATVGGIFATNTSGPRRFGWGRPRDLIIGVSFVMADGEVVKGGGRVVKNVAGYDLPKLMTGSMGTLGIITQLTLKVRPMPEASAIVLVECRDATDAGSLLDRLNLSRTRPAALELLNAAAAERALEGHSRPSSPWCVAIGFEGTETLIRWQVENVKEELEGRPSASVQGLAADPVWAGLIEHPTSDDATITIVANVRPSNVAGFAGSLPADRWSVQAHAGNGIVLAHAKEDRGLDETAVEIEAFRTKAVASGGNLVLPRCPTEWKERLRIWGEPRPDWAIAARVKQALDPGAVMNPGRFVGTI